MIALIPARSGSKRLIRKNLKELGGKPLVLWALQNAFDSEVFSDIYICTDSAEIAELAISMTGCNHIHRPDHLATDDSCDIEWVKHALGMIEFRNPKALDEEIAIIRPTSPFLAPETIQRAKVQWDDIKGSYSPTCRNCRAEMKEFVRQGAGPFHCPECGASADGRRSGFYDSMRAIRRATETPWKMWRYAEDNHEIDPITSVAARKHLHSRPTQTLEDAYIQTAGLEMAWTKVPIEKNTIAGDRIAGFLLDHPDSLDINTPEDWERAEHHLARLRVGLES